MASILRKKGLGRCSHCGLDGVHAKKDGTAFQHCHSRINGKNMYPCLGSGKPLEDLMWFSTFNANQLEGLKDISKDQVNQKIDHLTRKLTSHQEDTLNILFSEFSLGWFTIKQCYPLAIRRPRFSIEMLYKKCYLIKDRNPDWEGPLFDDFHRFRICDTKLTQIAQR